jgi:hypothetical protein
MSRFLSLVSLVGLTVIVACGPDGREADDGLTIDAGSMAIDAEGFIDAALGPDGDGPPASEFTVYVHTRDTLYTVDPTTWDVTLVGKFQTNGDLVTDLAVTSTGIIYAISQTKLYTVNATTGVATFKADLSAGAGGVGLTFLNSGELLGADQDGGVWKINPTTGVSSTIGTFGALYATAGDLVAVEDGTMYALSDKGPNGNENNSNLLLEVNTTTGQGTPVGQGIGYGRVFGAAFINGQVIAFNTDGQIIEINPVTGAGALVKTHADLEFWGAGVTPRVPGVE